MTIGQMIQFFPRLQRGHGYGIGKRRTLVVDRYDPKPLPPRPCVVRGCVGRHNQDRVKLAEGYIANDLR